MNSQDLAAWKAKREAAIQRANQKRAERARNNTQYRQPKTDPRAANTSQAGLAEFMPPRSRYESLAPS